MASRRRVSFLQIHTWGLRKHTSPISHLPVLLLPLHMMTCRMDFHLPPSCGPWSRHNPCHLTRITRSPMDGWPRNRLWGILTQVLIIIFVFLRAEAREYRCHGLLFANALQVGIRYQPIMLQVKISGSSSVLSQGNNHCWFPRRRLSVLLNTPSPSFVSPRATSELPFPLIDMWPDVSDGMQFCCQCHFHWRH